MDTVNDDSMCPTQYKTESGAKKKKTSTISKDEKCSVKRSIDKELDLVKTIEDVLDDDDSADFETAENIEENLLSKIKKRPRVFKTPTTNISLKPASKPFRRVADDVLQQRIVNAQTRRDAMQKKMNNVEDLITAMQDELKTRTV